MLFDFISRRSKPVMTPGLFIPGTKQIVVRKKPGALVVVPVIAVALLVTATAATVVARVSPATAQVASPIVVLQQTEPYRQTVVGQGEHGALSDVRTFTQVKTQLAKSTSTLIALDLQAGELTLFQAGVVVMQTPLQVAADTSWHQLKSGVYTVTKRSTDSYSSLKRAYYPYRLAIDGVFALHGTPQTVDGYARTELASLGAQIANTDMEYVYALSEIGTQVVVRGYDQMVDTFVYTPKGPQLPVRSYLVADMVSGAIIDQDAAQSVPIASLTKLMTALVVAEQYDLENEVPVIQEAYVTTTIPRLPGTDQTSIYDLLQLLLLESSNEAAEVLASQVGRDQFIAYMNERAKELQMHDTQFTDPSGLDTGNTASAQDMFNLIQEITRTHPFIWRLTTTEGLESGSRLSDFAELENYNEVAELDTFKGGKIGETRAALQTSITVHDITIAGVTRTVAIIVLGSRQRDADVARLHRYVETQFEGE